MMKGLFHFMFTLAFPTDVAVPGTLVEKISKVGSKHGSDAADAVSARIAATPRATAGATASRQRMRCGMWIVMVASVDQRFS
jgi:hypothetical protein